MPNDNDFSIISIDSCPDLKCPILEYHYISMSISRPQPPSGRPTSRPRRPTYTETLQDIMINPVLW